MPHTKIESKLRTNVLKREKERKGETEKERKLKENMKF